MAAPSGIVCRGNDESFRCWKWIPRFFGSPSRLLLLAAVVLTIQEQVCAREVMAHGSELWARHAYVPMSGKALTPLSPQESFGELHLIECSSSALQAAIAALNRSQHGGTIRFRHGGQPRTIQLDTTLILSSKGNLFVLDGEGYVTLDGGNATGMIRSTNQVWLMVQGIDFINGHGETGSAIYIANSGSGLMAINCHFRNNHNTGRADINGGGGVKMRGINVSYVSNCSFVGNSAYTGGALAGTGVERMVLLDCLFQGNRSINQFDGISTNRSFDVREDPFVFNFKADSTYTFAVGGEGRYEDGSTFTVSADQTISFQKAGKVTFAKGYPAVGHEGGGAVRCDGVTDIVEVYRCVFADNSATSGGSGLEVFAQESFNSSEPAGRPSAVVDRCYFRGNRRETELNKWTWPKRYGGALRHAGWGRLVLTNSVFVENEAELGTVTLLNQSDADISNCFFIRNTIYRRPEKFVFASSTVRGTTGQDVSVSNCTFYRNEGCGYTLFLNADNRVENSIFDYNLTEQGLARFQVQGSGNTVWPKAGGAVTRTDTFRDSLIQLIEKPNLEIRYGGGTQRPMLGGQEVGATLADEPAAPSDAGLPEISTGRPQTGAPKPALEAAANPKVVVPAEVVTYWHGRLIERIVASAQAGKPLNGWVNVNGKSATYPLLGADEKTLQVKIGGTAMPVPWSWLEDADRLALAKSLAEDSSVESQLILAVYLYANGQIAGGETALARAALIDAESAAKVREDLKKRD